MAAEFTENEPQNCWEFMECQKEIREECIVYETDPRGECWFLMVTKNGCPASKNKDGCFGCDWFKKHNQ